MNAPPALRFSPGAIDITGIESDCTIAIPLPEYRTEYWLYT